MATRKIMIDNDAYYFNFEKFIELFNRWRSKKKLHVGNLEEELAKCVNKDTSTIHNWRYKTSGPSDIDTIKLISSFFEISDYKTLLIDKVGKEKIDMKLSDLQILSIKRVYDAIIDFLYEFEKSNGFNDYWFDLDIHPQSRESELYDMAVASVEKVELVLKKEYCFLGKTKIYIELMDFVYNDLYDIFDGKLSYAYRFEAIVDGNPTTSDDYYKTLNKINEIIEKYVDFSK